MSVSNGELALLFTQPSSVKLVPSVTLAFERMRVAVPLNATPFPYCPPVHVPLVSVPARLLPELSGTLVPLAWFNAHASSGPAGGGPVLLTVTATWADVVWLPAASRARAVSVWPAFVAVVVFHETLYGD